MTSPEHFESLASWDAARERVDFTPVAPKETLGHPLARLALFVRDHRLRKVPPEGQSIEAHYGAFVLTQSRPGAEAAARAAYGVSYGRDPRTEPVGTVEARVYERGPEPEPGDPDGRAPAVVAWAVGDRFFLLASDALDTSALLEVARSIT